MDPKKLKDGNAYKCGSTYFANMETNINIALKKIWFQNQFIRQ